MKITLLGAISFSGLLLVAFVHADVPAPATKTSPTKSHVSNAKEMPVITNEAEYAEFVRAHDVLSNSSHHQTSSTGSNLKSVGAKGARSNSSVAK